VLDDVTHLVGTEPEVHRHQHPSPAAHTEERRHQPARVLAHDRDPLSHTDAELIELRRLAAREIADLGIRQRAQARRRLVRLVDHPDSIAVHRNGAVDEVADTERDEHSDPS
jgi:hypothetical protein